MTTTFFTAANTLYEPFVLPYAVSVLHHNDDSVVEVGLEHPRRFRRANTDALAVIARYFPDRFLIRGAKFAGIRAGAPRFLEKPKLKSEFTYIGDVDILVLDRDVTDQHLAHMERTGLPYSNILRPAKPRLTGLHFTRSDDFYPAIVPREWNLRSGNSEELLYRMTVEKGTPLPDPADRFRPCHGIHLSVKRTPTRAPNAGPPWQLSNDHTVPYLALWEAPAWQEVAEHFHPAYRFLLMVLEATIQAQVRDQLVYRRNEAVSLWTRLAMEDALPNYVNKKRSR
jgi:hypothetical protein